MRRQKARYLSKILKQGPCGEPDAHSKSKVSYLVTSSCHLARNANSPKVHRRWLPGAYRSALRITNFLMLCSLFIPSLLLASHQPAISSSALSFSLVLDRAISQHLIAGGVIVTGNHEGILSTVAKGRISPEPGAALIDDHTIFDLASLTKVVATAPVLMKLLEDGQINLSDPLSRWFPEFAGAGQGEITVLHLLTHTSGLRDFDLSANHAMRRAVKRAAAQSYRQWTGVRFEYADINFILLGELVRRVSGQTLDTFCRRQIYDPLDVHQTTFLPGRELRADLAPTAGFARGVVGDANARRLGSVAGHAGLFSSAYDLSRFARLMLGGGMIDNKRILSEQVVAQMTSPYLCENGQVRRGLGWDISSPFSSSKGIFSMASFGHTGYSGSSIWIDPQQDRFVILLTRRVNYRDTQAFSQLRRDVSTIASVDFDLFGGDRSLEDPLSELAKLRARLLQPEQVILQPTPAVNKVAARSVQKSQHQLRVQRRNSQRQLAKARGGHRGARYGRIARNEKTYKSVTGNGIKKRKKSQKRISA